uniref:Rho guanine nucleotide exchange factor 26 n=1 Tax=Biomphalaria glabrata TaxID=6526 RepID=A0A2C9L2K1_BIOGL
MASNNAPVSAPTARLPRASIHTPLKPASVQDLKAKFDPGSVSGSAGDADKSAASSAPLKLKTSHSPLSDRKGPSSGSESPTLASPSYKSSSVTISSLSSSLQAAAQRKIGSTASSTTQSSLKQNSTFTSNTQSSSKLVGASTTSQLSSKVVSNSTSSVKVDSSSSSAPTTVSKVISSVTLTTARPYSAAQSSKISPVSSLSKNNSVQESTTAAPSAVKKWEPGPKNNSTTINRNSTNTLISSDGKHIFEKDKDGRLELPVMHIISTGSDVSVQIAPNTLISNKFRNGTERKTEIGSHIVNKSTSDLFNVSVVGDKGKSSSQGNSPKLQRSTRLVAREIKIQKNDESSGSEKCNSAQSSPPVQRTSRLVAREIKIERLDSGEQVTTYKQKPQEAAAKSQPSKDISNSKDLNTRSKVLEVKVERVQTPSSAKEKPEFTQVKLRNVKALREENEQQQNKGALPDSEKRLSRKISSERFERLMFDFQRGVPTEAIPWAESETDHIILQQKARELHKVDLEEDVPIIIRKKKEESIFTEGLKVSDFVKQVNKMNPEAEGPPKWKIQKARSQTSSTASSDVGGDNFYQGIPGEEEVKSASDGEDDIYETVNQRVSVTSTEESPNEIGKVPSRRLGVYSQMKHFKKIAIQRLKQRGSKKKQKTSTESVGDSEDKTAQSDGEQTNGSSSGTEYEDVEAESDSGATDDKDCFYEDLEEFNKPASSEHKNKTLGKKLKNIFSNKKGKNKKSKPSVESAGTDSEGDFVEEVDDLDNDVVDSISRTSSERSSGRFTREDITLSSISTASAATTSSYSQDLSTVANSQSYPPMASNMPPPPPLPPRTSKVLNQPPENSPPLPPRNPALSNKATLGVSLDTVVPVSPPAPRSSGNFYGNKKKDRFSFGSDLSDLAPASGKSDYVECEPALVSSVEKLERTDRKSSNASRPSSSASSLSASSYVYPDISAFPELKGGGSDENLYVDLEDEHIYGRTADIYVSRFQSEPLYQWYSKDKMIKSIRSDKSTADELSDEDYLENEKKTESLYEDVERLLEKTFSNSSISTVADQAKKENKEIDPASLSAPNAKDKPQRRSVIEDVFKRGGTLHRALWCQMPEVIESGLLQTLSDQEKKIQEAMFEIMTSEASYLKSLKVLINVFVLAPEFSAESSDKGVISRRDRQILFSNIGHIKDISEEFLKDLEARWQESCHMKDVCDIIYHHASTKFEPYVRYCSNQAFQDRMLNNLKQKPEFNEAVKKLEQNPECQFLPLASFLLLPMQRITRMPLLVDAICHRLEAGTPKHTSAKKALDSLTKVAKRCDEAAKKMQQTEQICLLASNLEFKVKEFPLVSSSRFLVKQGEMTLIKSDGTSRKPLSKLLGPQKEHVYLFLFNDILLVTKKKGNTYQVRDYCQRNALCIEAIDNPEKSRHFTSAAAAGVPNILLLAMLLNHENKQVELILSCKSESERARWIDALSPSQTTSDNERIYDFWDCPQFQCVRKYIAQQPDEITLEEGDVINVTRKMADGWCEGERIRDGNKGWFPASHTEEINNSHVRARNLRLRYRLLIASQEFSQNELTRH